MFPKRNLRKSSIEKNLSELLNERLKLTFITAGDIHGYTRRIPKFNLFLKEKFEELNFDFINFSGDYLPLPESNLTKAAKGIAKLLDMIKFREKPILCLGGNYEPPSAVFYALEELGDNIFKAIGGIPEEGKIRGGIWKIKDMIIIGVEGSNPINGLYPGERSEHELEEAFKLAQTRIGTRPDIILTHAPPLGIRDKLGSYGLPPNMWGKHVGSIAFRKIAERFKPLLFICGHIHEALGITVYDWDNNKILLDEDITGTIYKALVIIPEGRNITVFINHGTLEYWNVIVVKVAEIKNLRIIEVNKMKAGKLDSISKLSIKLTRRNLYDNVVGL